VEIAYLSILVLGFALVTVLAAWGVAKLISR
jgi:hypothetical protein